MMKDSLNDLIEKQEEVMKEIQLARGEEWKSYITHQRADDELSKITRDELMRILSSDEFQNNISNSPEFHLDWGKWLLDKELERSTKYMEALSNLYVAQEEYLRYQARVKNLKDVLDSLNIRIEVLKSYG